MQINWLLASLIFTTSVSGHGTPKSLTIGGKSFTICTGVANDQRNVGSVGWDFDGNGPIESLDLPGAVCNNLPDESIAPTPKEYAAVKAGDKVEVDWGSNWPKTYEGYKDFWLGRCTNDCIGEDVTKVSWFKIGEIVHEGGKWHQSEPIDSCTLPSDIKDGFWILRHTRVALHTTGQPALYAHCYRLKTEGGGSSLQKTRATW
jgi:hypothetical protein